MLLRRIRGAGHWAGNRIYKSVSSTSYTLSYFGMGSEELLRTDSSGNTTDEFIFFGGARVAHISEPSGTVYYYAADMLGSSRAVVQSGQTGACYEADFYPFGGERAVTSTCGQDFKFEGKQRDSESGLDDFGARYYSSAWGRFASSDWSAVPVPVPYANLTNPQTLNLYAMVSDNPETFSDLDGHAPYGGAGPPPYSGNVGTASCSLNGIALGCGDVARLEGSNDPDAEDEQAEQVANNQAQRQQTAQPHKDSFFHRFLGKIGGWFGAAATPFVRWGRLGGPAHRATIRKVKAQLEEEGYIPDTEVKIATPNGAKSSRFVDVAGYKEGEQPVYYQVGKQNLDGTPVAREVQALDDIEGATGIRPTFVPYNAPEGPVPTLIPRSSGLPLGSEGEVPEELPDIEIPFSTP